MQRKKPKRSIQEIRKRISARTRDRLKPLCKQAGESSRPKKVIANGLLALRLAKRHGLEVYPNIDGKYNWEKVDSLEKILSDIVPVYLNVVNLLNEDPLPIEFSDYDMPKKLLADLNQRLVAGGEVVELYKDDDKYKLMHVEHLPSNEAFNLLFYADIRSKLSGKYGQLFDRAIKTLTNGCGIYDWRDAYDYHFETMDWEDMYIENDDYESLEKLRDIKLKYENGTANKAITRVGKSKQLTEKYISRYRDDNHPVSSFAVDVFELAKDNKNVHQFSDIIDDSHHGCALEYWAQFMISYEEDEVHDYYMEFIDNMGNEGTQLPNITTELTADMTELPVMGQEQFTFKLYKLFDKWYNLEQKISEKNRLVNVVTVNNQDNILARV